MSSKFIYYVYAYVRKTDGTPYYIGKGHSNRAFSKRHNVTVPDKTNIIFIERNLSEIGALALERRLIKWWGRKDLGTGILYNRTNGGDGRDSSKVSDETKIKMSKSHLGKKKSQSTREKMSYVAQNRVIKDSTKKKLSEINSGKIIPHTTKEKISNTMKERYKNISSMCCDHCGFIGNGIAMKRWHFSNCKFLREKTL